MPSNAPPPPPRKPPAPKPPAPKEPYEQEPPASNTGMILAIVGVILFLVIGLPILGCIGLFGVGFFQGLKLAKEAEQQAQVKIAEEEMQHQAAETALLVRLKDVLYPQAKEALAEHWTEPESISRRRWADWSVSKLDERRFQIQGVLQLGIRDGGSRNIQLGLRVQHPRQPHQFPCQLELGESYRGWGQYFP